MSLLPDPGARWVRGALIAVVVGSVLAIGTVHAPFMVAAAGLSAIALATATVVRRKRLRFVPGPALVMFALALYCLFQLIPLPMSWLEVIAPANADVWARALQPFGDGPPNTAPISLDPGATWIEALRWFSYGAVFTAASTLATRRGSTWGVGLVFVSALVAAVVTIGHGLVGTEKVFGIYEPAFRPQAWHVGPLLNPNNLSGYLNLGAMSGLGLMMMRKPVVPRWVVALGVAVLLGVNVTTASRGGVAIMLVGIVAMAITVELTRRRRAQNVYDARLARMLMGATIAFGLLLAFLGSTPAIWRDLYNENIEKLAMIEWFKPMIGDFRFFGAGRGAFESVFPAYQPTGGSTVYTHAENFIAHWTVEWGVPVTAAALLAFAWFFRPSKLAVGRSAIAAGAWFGLMVVLVQNLADLALEIPAVCFAIAMLLGSLWGDVRRVTEPVGDEVSGRVGAHWGAVIAVFACALLFAVGRTGFHDVTSDRLAIKASFESTSPPRDGARRRALRGHLREATLRHPAEPYFPLVGGLLAWQERDDNPMPWLQRTLERSMVNGKAHLLLASVLVRYDAKDQALMELRLAVEHDPTLVAVASKTAARWVSTLDEAERVIPRGDEAVFVMDSLAHQIRLRGDSVLGAELDRTTLDRDSRQAGPHRRLATDILTRIEKGVPCDDACKAAFDEHVRIVESERPDRSHAGQLRARWLLVHDQAEEAESLIAGVCDEVADYDTCLGLRVDIASKLKDPERLRLAGKAMLNAVCMDADTCASKAEWLGGLHSARREWGAAMASYKRALRDRQSVRVYSALARCALKQGLSGEAVRALERANTLHRNAHGEDDPHLVARLKTARQLFAGSVAAP